MSLKLNRPSPEQYKEFSKEATGHNFPRQQLAAIQKEGRIPMGTAKLFQKKLEFRNGPTEIYDSWNYSFHTADLNVQKGNEIKIGLTTYGNNFMTPLGVKYLNLIGETGLDRLYLSLEQYDELKGEGIIVTKTNKLAKRINADLTKEEAKNSLLWRVLLRHPDEVPKKFAIPGLCEEAIDYIFSASKQRYSFDFAMGVAIESFGRKARNYEPSVKLWTFGDLLGGSLAFANSTLEADTGCMVGIYPSALNRLIG